MVEDPIGRTRIAWLAPAAILARAACPSLTERDGAALTAEADSEIEALAVATPRKRWNAGSTVDVEWAEESDFGGSGGAVLAWADEEPFFIGEVALDMWIDGAITYGPGKARGR